MIFALKLLCAWTIAAAICGPLIGSLLRSQHNSPDSTPSMDAEALNGAINLNHADIV